MADKLLGRIGDLVEIGNQLRRENLYDTEKPAFQKKPVAANLDPALRNERTWKATTPA